MRAVTVALVAVLLAGHAAAISIKWTGYASNNQWDTNNNWYPNNVPGPNDDVTIDSGVVFLTTPTGVNSLVMGTSFDAPANLTLFANFYVVESMTVDGNGNLFINSGGVSVTGTVNVGGQLYFGSGSVAGQWTIGNRGVAYLNTPGLKAFVGAQFNVNGAISLSGILALNQSSVIAIASAATAQGTFAVQAQDSTPVLFDTSAGSLTYQGGGNFQLQAPAKIGTFTLQSGNMTLFNALTFVNTFNIPTGSYVATVGNAVVNMSAGVTGGGVLTATGQTTTLSVNMTGAVNCGGGITTFVGASNSANLLTLFGGTTVTSVGVQANQLNLLSGVFQGVGIVAINGYIATAGFSLNGPIHLAGSSTAAAKSIIAFGPQGRITFGQRSTTTVTGSIMFTGAPGSAGVINNGVVVAQGSVAFQNVNLAGLGNLNVSGTVQFNSIKVTQNAVALSGNGAVKGANTQLVLIGAVSSSTGIVSAKFGTYQVACPKMCENVSTNGITPTSPFVITTA